MTPCVLAHQLKLNQSLQITLLRLVRLLDVHGLVARVPAQHGQRQRAAVLHDVFDDAVLPLVDIFRIEALAYHGLKQQHGHQLVDPVMESIDHQAKSVQVELDEGSVRVVDSLLGGFPAMVEQCEVLVDLLLVELGQGERGVLVAGLPEQGCFQDPANTSVAIPEWMDELKVEMDQGGAKQGRHFGLHQLLVPLHQPLHQACNVPAVLGRLVAATVVGVAHEGGAFFGVVAEEAGAIVGVGQIPADLSMDGPDVIHGEPPTGVVGRGHGQIVGGLDVPDADVLLGLDLGGLQVQGTARLFFSEIGALDGVCAEYGLDQHFALKLVGHPGQGRGAEPPPGVLCPHHRHGYGALVDPHLESEGTKSLGFYPEDGRRHRWIMGLEMSGFKHPVYLLKTIC